MRNILLILIWIIFLIVDGMILPSLRIGSGFGPRFFLATIAVSFGVTRPLVVWGLAAAFVMELWLGFYFGSLMGPWLLVAWSWHFLNRFFNFKSLRENDSWFPLIPSVLAGLLLFAVAEFGTWAITKFIYESSLSILPLKYILISPEILATISAEFLILLILMKYFYKTEQAKLYG